MSGYSYAKIQDLETSSRLAITNARTSSDISSRLAGEGYDTDELSHGLALCDALASAVASAGSSLGAQKQNTQAANEAVKEARNMLALFRVKAVQCYPSSSVSQAYDALRLGVAVPLRVNEFLSYARSVVNTALTDASILSTLTSKGYDETKLKSVMAKISEAEQINQNQELAKGSRQAATQALHTARQALVEWWTPFKRVVRRILTPEQLASLQI